MINDRNFFSVPGNGEVCVIQGGSSRIDTLSNHLKYAAKHNLGHFGNLF